MNRLLSVSVAASMAMGVAVPSHAATTVDFEGYSPLYDEFQNISYQGLNFGVNSGIAYVWDGQSPNSNRTNNLILGFGSGDSLTITRTGGGLFSLSSIDLALSWFTSASSANIIVNGNALAITNSLTTYSLGLNNVSSVTISGIDAGDGYWTADNLVFSTAAGGVPEPTTWAMLILGFFGVGAAIRAARRRQNVTVSYA